MTEIFPVKADWTKILAELDAAGYTTYHLSNALGKKYETVKAWKLGGEPRHSDGVAILELHLKVCKCST